MHAKFALYFTNKKVVYECHITLFMHICLPLKFSDPAEDSNSGPLDP